MLQCSLMSMGTPVFYFKIEFSILWKFSGQSLNENLLSVLFQRNYFKPFFHISCTITILEPFWRKLNMRFGLRWKQRNENGKCAFLTTLLHIIFCFSFCRKTHAWIPRKYDVLWNCFKIQQLQVSLRRKLSSFFVAPEVVTEFSAAWCLSIVVHSLFGVNTSLKAL